MRVSDTDLGRFWKELVPAGGQLKVAEVAAIPRVWLDGRVGASLDRSTAQIGAPDVWQAGYRGDGVKVAVLDTGVDQTHPDLAGRIAKASSRPPKRPSHSRRICPSRHGPGRRSPGPPPSLPPERAPTRSRGGPRRRRALLPLM
ncbi:MULTISPECIES: S8 family serine peptidase [Streptomyces]|uniref:S8 family serine peptidase n=1 Tax=Streptomyces TaxID=1883 RepID=UPI0015D4B194